jgi:NAD(P)-dependent dehydrogenase (short-subunit alcohol dehydrogenase family)
MGVAVITGTTHGIGRVTARELAKAGLTLVMLNREPLVTRATFGPERGARTTLYLALSNDVSSISGRYFDEHQAVQPASSLANEVRLQEDLWAASEDWTRSAVE